MPETINLAKARELLAAAVETQGKDFIYKAAHAVGACEYAPIDAPMTHTYPEDDPRRKTGCLVGVALGLHGIDVSQMAGSIALVAGEHPGLMTEGAAAYFQAAQIMQDAGSTWGDALSAAEDWTEDEGSESD